ncbi:major facilitator superfamily domain-containing protein [Xylogone sp. PMI_703]|nr:major facilitator superfamily domain-containing protein [Xylogone sp. PMI_703]
MDRTFHNTSEILASFSISIFVLGFAVGPLVLSPLSEIYGRIPVLNYANVFLTVWQIGCALAPNIGALIGFRFLAGIGGSACLTVGGGVIADLFPVEQRGKANAAFSLGPLFGPVVGPIIGGFIAQRAGWRWVYWVLLMACGALTVGNAVFNRETNAVVIIRRKTEKLRKELGRDDLQSAYDAGKDPKTLQKRTVLLRGIVRPVHMLLFSPIFFLLAIYMSFVFALLYLIFTTITDVFINSYGFAIELCGLAYLGPGIGFALGLIAFAKTSDKTIIRLTKANNGVYQPEMRLASCLFFALFIPISFFWYGWTTDKRVHWIVPIIGLIPFGFGLMGIFAPIQTYFIDAGGPYAASAVAGLTACRCLMAAFLPLAAPSMYDSLGLGWGNSLLGFVALGLIPAPALIYKYGGAIRKKYPIRLD